MVTSFSGKDNRNRSRESLKMFQYIYKDSLDLDHIKLEVKQLKRYFAHQGNLLNRLSKISIWMPSYIRLFLIQNIHTIENKNNDIDVVIFIF